jgi:GH15 family glucan-1,4-alpha-glucosidase
MIENTRKHPMFSKGIAYITLPLAWSHAEFIRTFNLYKKYLNC